METLKEGTFLRYYMLHKPSGCVTAKTDPALPTVMDLLPPDVRCGLHAVGRLDRDTTGLLLLTDDGALTFRLTRPEFSFPKRYFFRAFGTVSEADQKRLQEGGTLYGNGSPAKPAFFSDLKTETVAENAAFLPEEKRERALKNPEGVVTTGVLTVTEGQRHEVKLLLRSCGCAIFALKRLSIGEITLDESLAPGEFRPLNETELSLVERYRTLYIENIGKMQEKNH